MFFKPIFLVFFSLWVLALVATPVPDPTTELAPPLPTTTEATQPPLPRKPLPVNLFRLGNAKRPVSNIRTDDFGDLIDGEFAASIVEPHNGLSTFESLTAIRYAIGKKVLKNVWTISTEEVQKHGFLVTPDGGVNNHGKGHVTISLTTPHSEEKLRLKFDNMPWTKLPAGELGNPPAPGKATLPPPKRASAVPPAGQAAQAPSAKAPPAAVVPAKAAPAKAARQVLRSIN